METMTEKLRDIKVKCNDCGIEHEVTAIANYDLKKIEQFVKCKEDNCRGNVRIVSVSDVYEDEA